MNARIQELWEHGTFTVIPREGDYSTVTAGSIKNFAELIIKECIELCKTKTYADPEDQAEYYVSAGAEGCGRLIKQHFVVEE